MMKQFQLGGKKGRCYVLGSNFQARHNKNRIQSVILSHLLSGLGSAVVASCSFSVEASISDKHGYIRPALGGETRMRLTSSKTSRTLGLSPLPV